MCLRNIAQIWSPYLYPSSDSPRYTMAFATNSVMAGTAIVFCFILRHVLKRANEAADRNDAEAGQNDVVGKVRYVL